MLVEERRVHPCNSHAVQGILGHFHRPAVILWGLRFQSLLELYKEEIACVVGLFFPHIIMRAPNSPLLNYGDEVFQLDETQSSAFSSHVQLAAAADLKPHKYLCGVGECEAGVSRPAKSRELSFQVSPLWTQLLELYRVH